MPLEFSYAAVSPFYIAAMIIYALYSLYKAGKKKEQKKGPKPNSKPQPGKSIEEVLREMERRVTETMDGVPTIPPVEEEEKPTAQPSLIKPKKEKVSKPREKTIAEFKAEKHSARQELIEENELAFDAEADHMIHQERNEKVVSNLELSNHLTSSDMRRAIILDAILNRPEY